MLGLGCLSEIAEIAWTQGRDLYSALDNRLMKGYEYLAKSNLGYEVPFFTWNITGIKKKKIRYYRTKFSAHLKFHPMLNAKDYKCHIPKLY